MMQPVVNECQMLHCRERHFIMPTTEQPNNLFNTNVKTKMIK